MAAESDRTAKEMVERAEREMIAWRSAFQSVTPGGSEFFDPKAVREWADRLKMDAFNANKRAVLSERRALTAEAALEFCWAAIRARTATTEEPRDA